MWTFAADLLAEAAKLRVPVTTLSAEECVSLHRELAGKYARSPKGRWPLWDGPGDDPSVQESSAWRWIGEYVGEKPATILWNPQDEPAALRFGSGNDLIKVLEEMYGTEFYVTDEHGRYLLCFNHHHFLVAYGDAAPWLRNRIGHG